MTMPDWLIITNENVWEIMENAKRILDANADYDPMEWMTMEQMVELFRNPPRLWTKN